MKHKKKPNKTRYCVHHHNCDRDENCMAGEYCPLFENNPETYTMPRNIEVDTFENAMDDLWEGKNE